VFERGAWSENVADVPVSPVCGLDPEETTAAMVSDEQVVLDPLKRVTV
jgi:hypothetical protein